MKKNALLLLTVITISVSMGSCKTMARAAAKYWTKKQIKEFVQNCEAKSAKLLGEEKAAKVCDCAVDTVAEKYKNYDDVKSASITEILKIANDCR